MVSKTILIGHLGKDVEGKTLESGTELATFSLATTEKYTNKQGEKVEETEWHNIVIYGRVAEIAKQYLKKGSKVYIEGKNKTRKWEDADGKSRWTTEVHVRELKMLGDAI